MLRDLRVREKSPTVGPMRTIPLLLIVIAMPGWLHAQQQPANGWFFTGQLTSVWTSGNSESRTLGLNGSVRRQDGGGTLTLESGGIRTEATRKTRRAVGTPASFEIEEEERRERTAEAYFARLRYDRKLSDHFVVFVGTDVLRNTFAGISHRVLIASGAGNTWVSADDFSLKTDYGVTWTFQRDVVQNPFIESNFPGARFSWDLRRRLTATTQFTSTLVSDLNFSDTDDIRIDAITSVAVSISESLSLKPSLQLLWRNQPALVAVDLYGSDGAPAGARVSVPLEKLDTFFTLALVVQL